MKLSEFFETNGWTQGAYARDVQGTAVDVSSPTACAFCLAGATYKLEVTSEGSLRFGREMREALSKTGIGYYVYWNDNVCKNKEELIAKLKELGL